MSFLCVIGSILGEFYSPVNPGRFIYGHQGLKKCPEEISFLGAFEAKAFAGSEPCTRFAGQCEITLNGRKFSARYNGLGEAGTDTGDLPRRSC